MTMYALSFAVLIGQYVWADVFHITLVGFSGTPLKNAILTTIQTDTLNQVSLQIFSANATTNSTITGIERAFTVGYTVGWDLITLLSGTYIFNFIYAMVGPSSLIFITPIVALYVFLLARAIMSYIRNG